MTTGEKIKLLRNLKKLSQKSLGDLAGISEIAIRKYEAGDRIPKPSQLAKLEIALEVDTGFLETPAFHNQNINTVGEVMSLLFLLDEQANLMFDCQKDAQGNIIPETAILRFANAEITKLLSDWISYKNSKIKRASMLNNFDEEEQERLKILEITIEEAEKQRLMNNAAPLKKRNP